MLFLRAKIFVKEGISYSHRIAYYSFHFSFGIYEYVLFLKLRPFWKMLSVLSAPQNSRVDFDFLRGIRVFHSERVMWHIRNEHR